MLLAGTPGSPCLQSQTTRQLPCACGGAAAHPGDAEGLGDPRGGFQGRRRVPTTQPVCLLLLHPLGTVGGQRTHRAVRAVARPLPLATPGRRARVWNRKTGLAGAPVPALDGKA